MFNHGFTLLAFLAFLIPLRSANPEKENIALGKKYEWSKAPNAFSHGYEGHPMCKDENDKTQLTDGEIANRCWWDKRTVGWWSEKIISITIDLEKTMPVNEIEVHLSSEREGCRVPREIEIFVSDDNKNFYHAKSMEKGEILRQWRKTMKEGKQDGHPHAWIKVGNLNVKGRYVILSFNSVNLYLDEIRIFSGSKKIDDIIMNGKTLTNISDLHPFYKREKAYAANNAILPIHLKLPKWNTGIDIALDLPKEISLAAPSPKSSEKIKFEGKEYIRFHLKKAKKLFLKSNLPEGTAEKIRITGLPSYKEEAGKKQIIDLETVKIPEVKPFKKLIANVGFTDFAYWNEWPNTVDNYKRVGLNLFTPLAGTDFYYSFLKRKNKAAINMIAEAKKKGLIAGANFSPFCNGAINGIVKKFNAGNAVYLNGKQGGNGCPRAYLEHIAQMPDGELSQIVEGAKNGIDFFIFDSEPHWTGKICACDVCERKWKEFLARKAPDLPFKSQTETYKSKDPVYMPLMQEFWDEFYVALWGLFKEKLQSAAKKKVTLGLYNCPLKEKQASGCAYLFGNNPSFLPLYNNNVIDFANPSMYLVPTNKLGARIRGLRKNLPPACPLYMWVTAGSTGINFERTPEDVRNRLLEIFFNGGQGFIFWSAYGVDAKDYQTIAKLIGELQPYENFFANGTLAPDAWFKAPEGIKVSGIKLGREAVILVSGYDKNTPEEVTLEIQAPTEMLSARIVESIDNGEKFVLKDGKFKIRFSGEEKDFCKIFHLHP